MPQPATVRLQEDLLCNFCTRPPTEVEKLLRLCGFYLIADERGRGFCRVVHDNLFLNAYAALDPQRLGHVCICDDCIVSGLGSLTGEPGLP